MNSRWLSLLLMTRLLAAAVAVLLLVVHRVTAYDTTLIVAVAVFTAVSLAAFRRIPRLQSSPLAWLVDGLAVLALVAASEDWRSPFYVLMLTALILPSTGLAFRRALAWGFVFMLAYLGVALYTELDANTLGSTIRLETIATHVMVPFVVVLALAYATDVLERLRDERLRSEQLAVESERQRIAWELPAHIAAHAYRIGAEALTNAVRHSEATRIDVVLERNGQTASIAVHDDGCGLPVIRRPGSNGLRSMRARAETIGATLSIGSGDDGRGTLVRLTLPTEAGNA